MLQSSGPLRKAINAIKAPVLFMEPKGPIYEGIFAVHKPANITSAGVLEQLKRQFNKSELFAPWIANEAARTKHEAGRSKQKWKKGKSRNQVKMGHGGTLDPQATGVLIVGVGRGTKDLPRFLECTKTYDATVLFGAATDTYDKEGKILDRADTAHITKELVEDKLSGFRGDIMQKPPIYSALNVKGKRMYEYAREGGEIPDLPERKTRVDHLEMTKWLDAGSHDYRFPTEKLDTEDAKAAKRILEKVDAIDAPAKKQKTTHDNPLPSTETDQAAAEPSAEAKSTTDEDPAIITHTASITDNAQEAKMSGALQESSSKEEQPNADPEPQLSDATKSSPSSQTDGSTSPATHLTMTVTSGFYVRSLCYDLGKSCSSLAFMADLVRTRQGDFSLGDNVIEFSDLEQGEEVWGPKVKRSLRKWMLDEGWIGNVEVEEDADDQAWMSAQKQGAVEVGRRAKREGEAKENA